MQSLYFVKLQTGRGQMTEERTGNNSPGVWHRHLCVLWAQVDSCLLSPPSPSLSLAPPECGRRGRTGGRGQGTLNWDMRLNTERREMLWTLTLVLNYHAGPRSDVGVTWCQAGLASSELTGPGLWRDIFFCFDSSAKICPRPHPVASRAERSFLLHILSWLGLPVTWLQGMLQI